MTQSLLVKMLDNAKHFKGCLHGVGGPQIGEVNCLCGVTRLSI